MNTQTLYYLPVFLLPKSTNKLEAYHNNPILQNTEHSNYLFVWLPAQGFNRDISIDTSLLGNKKKIKVSFISYFI